ncbi:unnamed protein product [Nippostrongylus brasiliensis]|uniref:Transcriptional regulator n=1 Tax=Nippostrongylus brasiliensis TaxID=27835 RepID=A0A0N4YM60_NIPBR|nr:unnamed protein product [Nippostrongylus brasiliensis]
MIDLLDLAMQVTLGPTPSARYGLIADRVKHSTLSRTMRKLTSAAKLLRSLVNMKVDTSGETFKLSNITKALYNKGIFDCAM